MRYNGRPQTDGDLAHWPQADGRDAVMPDDASLLRKAKCRRHHTFWLLKEVSSPLEGMWARPSDRFRLEAKLERQDVSAAGTLSARLSSKVGRGLHVELGGV